MSKRGGIKKVIAEVRESPKVIWTFNNWWVYFLSVSGLSKKETACKLRNGTKFIIRPNSFDIRMIKEVIIHNPYHRLKINKGDTVVDIGAHIGAFSIMAGRKTGVNGNVYAYEPVPSTFDILRRNIYINSLQNIISPYKLCISDKRGEKKFYLFKKDDKSLFHSSSFYQEQLKVIDASICEKIEVKCITFEDIIKSNSIDRINVLKMDCEGEEYNLLFGTSTSIYKRIDKMCIEYHDYLSAKYNYQDLINYLLELKYEVLHEVPKNSERGCGIIYAWRGD